MPVNKLALLRFKTIDKCLQNRARKWTLEDLMEAVSDALYEYEGITDGVGKRTIQQDIQNMRSDKLGYHAPIVVMSRKFYTYAEKDYSITNSPLSASDLEKLSEVVGVLKQFKGFSYFQDLTAMVTRLEDKVQQGSSKTASYIDFDKNELLKGLEYIDPIHRAIQKKQALHLRYQSFLAPMHKDVLFHPYLLKEYNNRWFVLGANEEDDRPTIMALDRIHRIKTAVFENYKTASYDVFHFFNDVIGVSKSVTQEATEIVLKINKKGWNYLKTKPLHRSQQVLEISEDAVIFSLHLIWNFELEREILGRAEEIEVLKPLELREKIIKRVEKVLGKYQGQVS